MCTSSQRDDIWASIDNHFDLIIIGGGITGGGIFREATAVGLKTLLVEAHDFASGTSSRSSKLVHGGFRYLKNGQLKVTFDSVRERERLLREGRGLINQIGFIIATYKGDRIPTWTLGLGLTLYDLLAWKWGHQYYSADGLLNLCPQLNTNQLQGGYRYFDALTDDARLVYRVIREGVIQGGIALNYARVVNLLRTHTGSVTGATICDVNPVGEQRTREIFSTVVINAAGAWVDDVRNMGASGDNQRTKILKLRKLRGSHLIFPYQKLPLTRAISVWHPSDKRPVFTFPWENVTIVGTTDVDHDLAMDTDPGISQSEAHYLLEAVNFSFPSLSLTFNDVQATFSGIRTVIDTGKKDPSKESREHIFWYEDGLLTVTGGKLTTFRLIARIVLQSLRNTFSKIDSIDAKAPILAQPDTDALQDSSLDKNTLVKLFGRYGKDLETFLAIADKSELVPIRSTPNLWAEIRWAARKEAIVHLDDLLLRRVRLGLLLACHGFSVIERIRSIVQVELGWDDERWAEEVKIYRNLIDKSYSLEPLTNYKN